MGSAGVKWGGREVGVKPLSSTPSRGLASENLDTTGRIQTDIRRRRRGGGGGGVTGVDADAERGAVRSVEELGADVERVRRARHQVGHVQRAVLFRHEHVPRAVHHHRRRLLARVAHSPAPFVINLHTSASKVKHVYIT